MNELEKYTASIPDSNPQKAELIRQWKIDNEWGKPVVEEAVKTEVVVEEDAPATTTPEASENLNSGDGQLESLKNNDPDLPSDQTLNINVGTQDVKAINNAVEKSMVLDAQTALENSEILFRENYDVFDPDGDGEAGQIGLEERKSNVGIVKAGKETEDDKLVRSFIEATDLQKNQFDDLYASIYDNEDLFAVTEVTSGGGGSSMTGYMPTTTTTVTANALKLQEAEDQLNEKVRKGEPKPTKEQIEYRARQNMFNTQARELKMSNARDFIFNIPEYKEDDEGNVLKDEDGNKIKNRSEKQNIIADFIVERRDIATWTVEDFGKELALDLGEFKDSKLLKATKASKEAIEKRQDEIKTLQETILQKRKKGESTLEEVSKYKELTTVYKDLVKYYNGQTLSVTNQKVDLENRITDYTNMIADLDDSGVQLDALSRVYKPFEKRMTDLALGSYGVLFANPAAFLEKVGNYLDDTGGEDETFFQDQVKQLAEVKEFVANKYYQPISFKDAFKSLDNFGEFAIDQAIQQAPIITALYTGQGGIYALGMGTAAEYDAGRKLESEKDGGRSYDKDIVFLQSLGFGAAESVFGAAPTALILRGTLRGANDFGRRKLLDGWKNYFRNIKTNAPLDIGLVGVDAGGEWATNVFQNFIDGRPANQGGLEAFTVGGMFGSVFTGMPYFKGAFAAALSDYKTNSDVRANLKIIEILSRSAQNPLLTKAEKERDAAMKQKLIDQNNEISKERIDLATNNLNKQGGDLLAETTVRQEQLRVEAESVQQNNSLDSETKNKLINDLNTEFDALENAADKFKVAFTNTFGLLTKKKQKALKDQAKTLLQIDNPGNPSKEQINRKAEQLHTKEKLEATLESDQATLKALAGAGIDVNYNVSDTNTGAIEEFTKMMLARAADPNNSITKKEADDLIKEFTEGIKDGTLNGFNVPSVNVKTGKKVYDVVTSVQNSVANERSKTQLHELGHIIATEAIGTDPAAFEELKDLILSYVKETNPEAHTRIIARTLNKDADEVMMVFFEEVADTRIDLKKAKGTGFLGYFGKMLGIATSKASNTDYDYNFNGEEDILAFAFEMATKLKNGTLTIEDVKDIQDKDYVVPDEVDMNMVNEEVVITAKSKKGKASKETTFTPEQDEAIGETINEIKALEKEGKAIAKKFGKPFQKGAKQIRLENELTASIKPLVEKIVTNRTKALYDPIADDAKRNVTRQEFQDSMRSDLQTMAINEYNGTQELEKFIINRGFLRANSLAQRLGIKSVEEGITQGIEAAEDVAAEDTTVAKETKDTSSKIKPSSFISDEAVAKIKEQILEKIEGIDPKNLTFKKLGDLAPEIIAAEIGIPVKKLTVPAANLSKGDATAIQQFVNNNADKLLKILPEGAVVEAATEKLLGTSTGVPVGLLNAFYTRQARLGKGAGLAPFKLNKGISRADFLEAFGIVEGKKAEGFDARSPQAQALKAIASLYGKLVTNEIVRAEVDLSLETKQDIAAGKNKAMASREVKAGDVRTAAEKSTGKITGSTLSNYNTKQLDDLGFKTVADVKEFLKLPVLPAREINGKLRAADKDILLKPGYKMLGGNLDLMTEAINAFLKEHPKYREIIRKSTTSSLSRSSMGSPKVFDRVIPKSDKKYDIIYRNPYKAKDRKLSKPFVKTTKSSDFVSDQYAKLDYLKNYWIDVQSFLKKKPELSFLFEQMLDDAQNDMGSLMRISPPILYLPLNSKGEIDFDVEIREEHNMPQNNVGSMLLDAAINGNVEQVFKIVSATYMQGPLTMADDNKVNIKYGRSMPDFFWEVMVPRILSGDLKIPEGTASLIRLVESDINLDNYKFLPENKTFSEYFFGTNGLPTNIQKKLLKDFFSGDITLENARKQGLAYDKLAPGMAKASKENNNILPKAIKYDRDITVPMSIAALEKTDKALANGRKLNPEVVKAYVMDLDDTLVISKSLVGVEMPDGKTFKINATEFAKRAGILEAQGAKFDFTEFEKIIEGKKGPLFKVLENINAKRGTKDFYILTARPAAAAPAIKKFLEALGISVPLKNITGLGDGKPEAKAGWFVGMAAKGYNDFYFADDHFGNVKAVQEILNVLDVKGKVQLAKASKEATFDIIVNDMIQDSSGIEAYKQYSAARAKTVGASKGKYAFLIPPSAEDFTGLLYKMLGKGKRGDAQMAFLKTNLLDPYDRAESAVTKAKIAAANDFKALKTQLTTLPKSLSVPTGIGGFTYSHAVRVAIWTMQGMEVPGLSKRDVKELNDFIKNDAELQAFVNELIVIQKGKPYPKPGKDWLGGNITTDIINNINKVNRAEYQQEWRENVDIIFSEANLNKMEAAYGTRWREALEDSIRRMKAGSNRPIGGNRTTEALLDWLNNSVGAVMFLNTRSALLQTISAVNFINWGDNNIVKAGAAFANQKQFWSDFMTLMNSDYLVERRNGLKINVSESEIADAVRDSSNKPKAAIAFLLSKGFVMTRFADSFAIAAGGSTFYRNRVKSLVAKGMDQKAAEAQAFEDFRQIAEESQQSSNPNRISAQQASAAGRVILAWANTPMQYARIQKRAAQDLINGRGDWKTNVSKIVYYGAIQNLIFNALQSAVFALGFGEDDEDKDAKKNEKISKIANGMIDSQLKGLGVFGTASVALKNTLMTLYEEHGKKGSKYENAIDDLLSFSPPLGSKIGKIKGGLRSFSWNMEEMKEKGFSLDNPSYLAGAQVVTGLTNLPLDRVMKKINNIRGMVNERSALWQKVALGLGWSTWELGLGYYGGFDAAKVLTPDEQLTKEVNDMKKLTKTKEQVDMLLDFGLTKKEIKALGKEDLRVRKIIELQKKDKK